MFVLCGASRRCRGGTRGRRATTPRVPCPRVSPRPRASSLPRATPAGPVGWARGWGVTSSSAWGVTRGAGATGVDGRAGFTGENRARRDERVCELSRSGFGTHRILYGPRVRVHVARRGEAHKASRILQDGQKDGQGGSKQPPADPRPQERPHEERRREEESPRDVGGDPTRLGFTPAPHPAPHGCVHVSLKKVREKDFSLLHV